MNDVFHIALLVIKRKFGVLTVKERSCLEQFEGKYPFVKTLRPEKLEERMAQYGEIDREAAWDTVLEKFENRKSPPPAPSAGRRWFKYAVAASLILLIPLSYMFYRDRPGEEPAVSQAMTAIEKGTDKAVLTLEDGSEVVLGAETTYKAKNTHSDGKQIIYNPEGPGTSEIRYNYLTVPRGGQFFIQLSDSTKVWLNSESRLKYPVTFIDGKPRTVELLYGEAYFEVSPATRHKGARFKVHTQVQEVEVLGTEFNIKAYRDESRIYTTLVEGKVTVNAEGTSRVLAPSQRLDLDLENSRMNIVDVDAYNEISWKKGVFSFKGMSLQEIAKVLSRWYDTEIEFSDPGLEKVRFNGVLSKDQDLEEILKIIQNTNFIHAYEIKNRKVIIR
ncbi:FecR domain-containing protein [Sinomicrobium soli]|uniref:FecR domain-containing protein n=1 Tax=Sinomicrobium sp. N-1-3-6 TaxID=2219864 RepID=UPI000DCF13F4|nr:FecR domain-containing protein [Sinomicrobium sp. N-1-3-6]RAV29161.1 anti-sigma factor [Sinomicrobium sp. N-1-3-6]